MFYEKLEISDFRRLGRKEEGKRRPILIKFTLAWRKMAILKNNKKLEKNIYATEDFPKEVIKKRQELKEKQQEELKKGNIAIIRYDKLIIREKCKQRTQSDTDTITEKDRENNDGKRKRSPTTSPQVIKGSEIVTSTAGPSKINKSRDFFRQRPNPKQKH